MKYRGCVWCLSVVPVLAWKTTSEVARTLAFNKQTYALVRQGKKCPRHSNCE